MIRSFLVAIEDAYGSHVKRNFLAHQIFALLICVLSFVVSFIFLTQVTSFPSLLAPPSCVSVSQDGLVLVQAFDQYVTVLLTLVLAFLEIMLVGWFYGSCPLIRISDADSLVTGGANLSQVIKLKISKALGCFLPISWVFVTPILLLLTLTCGLCFYKEPMFRGTNRFPLLMHFAVVGLAIAILLLIPVVGYHQVLRTPRGNLLQVSEGGSDSLSAADDKSLQRVLSACRPFEQESPQVPLVADPEASDARQETQVPRTKQEEKGTKVPITLSLIQGLDRETDL